MPIKKLLVVLLHLKNKVLFFLVKILFTLFFCFLNDNGNAFQPRTSYF